MLHNLGWPEILLVLVIILLIFGTGKLSQIGGALGKSIREFRQESRGEVTDGPTRNYPIGVASPKQKNGLPVARENREDIIEAAMQSPIPDKNVSGRIPKAGTCGWCKRLLRRS